MAMTILDAYQAIDEVIIQYIAGGITAENAMLNIGGIIDEQESEDECDPRNSVCVNEDVDCYTCHDYWLDFHADGMKEGK